MLQSARIGTAETSLPFPVSSSAKRSGLSRSRALTMILAGIVLAGFMLRVQAARGELWLDEIWSLTLVAPLHSAAEVFWGISHDNNHFLNSLWLYWVGPDRAALVYRLPAVIFGTLSIIAATRIGLRRGAASGIAAALLTAFSFPLVNYGSEARGYGGLVLAILVAIDALEQAIAPTLDPSTGDGKPHRWILGLAIGLGTLSHLTMLFAAAALGATATVRFLQAGRRGLGLLGDLVRLFAPSALLLMPTAAAIMGGIAVKHGFTVGGAQPFVAEQFIAGYADLIRFMTGLPSTMPFWAVFGVVGFGLLTVRAFRLVDRVRGPLLVAALMLVPGAMLLARLSNLEYPRYYLTSGIVLLLCGAEVFSRLWSRSVEARAVAVVVLSLILLGQIAPLACLLRDGRGGYAAALSQIKDEGGVTYASNRDDATAMVVEYLSGSMVQRLTSVRGSSFCAARPDWVIDSVEDSLGPADRITLGSACKIPYERRGTYPTSALSGMTWTLYRRG